MPHQNLTFTHANHIATLTLTRPDILNRLDHNTTAELVDVIESLRRPGDIRVLILASTGTAFSAGGDLDEVRNLINDFQLRMEAYDIGRRLIYGMAEIAVPVIAALHGDVFGLGTSIALSADLIVAAKNIRIADPHVRVGLVAGDGGCAVWPAAFGMARAKRHLLTGDAITGEEAYRLGGVTDLVETPEEVLPLAQKLAAKIAALPPVAVQFTKRSLNHVMQKAAHDAFEFSMALEQYVFTTSDLVEAVDAFKEKRQPVYRNK